MPSIRPLELSDRPMVEAYVRRYPPEISELTFTNLFVWRNSRPVSLAPVNDAIVFVINVDPGDPPVKVVFGHPIGKWALSDVVEGLGGEVAGFVRVPADEADVLRQAGMHVEADRNNSDYVYRVVDLAELVGRRFHKKRNLIKHCLAAYSCEYEPITPERVQECSDMQDRWCKARQCGLDTGLCSEYAAIQNMFAHYEALHLIGGAIRVDGAIEAYAIGEQLRPDTAVWHFEKATPGFRGLGQLINQLFSKYSLSEFEFVNREQDLGIPGLRKAKESYYPHHMVDKFNAWSSSFLSRKPLSVDPHECDKYG
jgi:hypothetical protein